MSEPVVDAADHVIACPRSEDAATGPTGAPDRSWRLEHDAVPLRRRSQEAVVVDHQLRVEQDERLAGLFEKPLQPERDRFIRVDLVRNEERVVLGRRARYHAPSVSPPKDGTTTPRGEWSSSCFLGPASR
jgi:hypothetical protein